MIVFRVDPSGINISPPSLQITSPFLGFESTASNPEIMANSTLLRAFIVAFALSAAAAWYEDYDPAADYDEFVPARTRDLPEGVLLDDEVVFDPASIRQSIKRIRAVGDDFKALLAVPGKINKLGFRDSYSDVSVLRDYPARCTAESLPSYARPFQLYVDAAQFESGPERR